MSTLRTRGRAANSQGARILPLPSPLSSPMCRRLMSTFPQLSTSKKTHDLMRSRESVAQNDWSGDAQQEAPLNPLVFTRQHESRRRTRALDAGERTLDSVIAWFVIKWRELEFAPRRGARCRVTGSPWPKWKAAAVCASAGSPSSGGARRAWTTRWSTSSGQSRRTSSWLITR